MDLSVDIYQVYIFFTGMYVHVCKRYIALILYLFECTVMIYSDCSKGYTRVNQWIVWF